MDLKYHPYCFICTHCGCTLKTEFFLHDQKPYCEVKKEKKHDVSHVVFQSHPLSSSKFNFRPTIVSTLELGVIRASSLSRTV